MRHIGLPPKQGLYDPQFEKDACGMGFVANIKGVPSHDIVSQALTMLSNMEHRGGQGSEPNSGDGAGILIQIPHRFFAEEAKRLGFALPEQGFYGVGMLFLSQDPAIRVRMKRALRRLLKKKVRRSWVSGMFLLLMKCLAVLRLQQNLMYVRCLLEDPQM